MNYILELSGLPEQAWDAMRLAPLPVVDGHRHSRHNGRMEELIGDKINCELVYERRRKVLNRPIDGLGVRLMTSMYAKVARCAEDTALRDEHTLIKRGVLGQIEGCDRRTSFSLAELQKHPSR